MLSKLKYLLVGFIVFVLPLQSQNIEVVQIKKQFIETLTRAQIDDGEIQNIVDGINVNGSWPDINYADTNRALWEPANHFARVFDMSLAYAKTTSGFYKNAGLRDKILLCMDYWIANDFKNTNWFYGRILIPLYLLQSMILLEDGLPNEYLSSTDKLTKRSIWVETGINKIALSANLAMKAILADDISALRTHTDSMWEEVKVTTDEGIQPDWSYHQHGPQLQFGNYGLAFFRTVSGWAENLRDTSYALKGEQLAFVRNFVLEGLSSIYWNEKFGIEALGRQVDLDQQSLKGKDFKSLLSGMKLIDPEYTEAYDTSVKFPNEDIKFRNFWRSDFVSCKRSDWYGSVRMSSKRVVMGESLNSENQLGLHLSDGLFMLYQTGEEYNNIQSNWDWHRLPGTTADQGITDLKVAFYKGTAKNRFAGTIGVGTNGLAAMELHREDLLAKKAWFFDEETIVCLGAGVRGTSKADVYTSIQQSLLKSTVESSMGVLGKGTHVVNKNNWIHQDGIGYELLDDVSVEIETVEGDWAPLFPTYNNIVATTKDVFSIWKNHGENPINDTYGYVVYPNTTSTQMPSKISNRPTILSNTPDLQAIEKEDRVYAVFHKQGTLTLLNGDKVNVTSPCLLSIQGNEVSVSDPNQIETTVIVTIKGQTTVVFLPSGDQNGKQINFKIGDEKVGELPDIHKKNVALLKTIINGTNVFDGKKLIDGNSSSNPWTFPTSRLPQYAEIDLEKIYNIEDIRVFTHRGDAVQYNISSKVDAADDYQLLVDKSLNTEKGTYLLDEFTTPVKARYLRVDAKGCYECRTWYGFHEIFVNGTEASAGGLSTKLLTSEAKQKFYSIENNKIVPENDNIEIKVYNFLGQNIKSSFLEKGNLYLIWIKDQKGKLYHTKFIYD